jgi:hypothetical protein
MPGASPFARLSHIEKVSRWLGRHGGPEAEFNGANGRALYIRRAKFCRRENARHMLRREARIAAIGANALDHQWAPGDGGDCKRGPQDLPAALAVGAVNDNLAADEGHSYPPENDR